MARAPQRARIARTGNARGAIAISPLAQQPKNAISAGLEAAAGVAQTVEDIERENQAHRDELAAVRAKGEYNRAVQSGLADLDPLADDYQSQAQSVIEDARETSTSGAGITNTEVSNGLGRQLESLSQADRTAAASTQRQAIEGEAIRVRGDVENETLARITQDPDGAAAYLEEHAATVTAPNASISPSQQRELNEAFANSAVTAQAEGFAQAGRYAEARKILDDNQGTLGGETHRRAKQRVRAVENEQRLAAIRATDRQLADLEIGLINGSSDIEQIQAADAAGLYENQQSRRVTHMRIIEARNKAAREAQNDMAAAWTKFQSGNGVDTQAEMDLVFEQRLSTATQEERQDPNFLADMLGQTAAEGGFMPSVAKQQVKNAERVENPELLANAARLHDTVRNAAPAVDTGAGERTALASSLVALTGQSYDDAAALVIERTPEGAQQITERRTMFEDLEFGDDVPDALEDLGFSGDAITENPAMRRRYENMVQDLYLLNGNLETAQAAAGQLLQREYGTSTIGGQERAMQFPPEQFFPGTSNSNLDPATKSNIITGDLTRSLQALGIEAAQVIGQQELQFQAGETRGARDAEALARDLLTPGPGRGEAERLTVDTSGLPPARLEPDRQTRKEIESGVPPTYQVRVRNAFGAYEAVRVRNPDGSEDFLRYTMPTQAELEQSPEYQERVADEAEKLRRGQKNRKLVDDTITEGTLF